MTGLAARADRHVRRLVTDAPSAPSSSAPFRQPGARHLVRWSPARRRCQTRPEKRNAMTERGAQTPRSDERAPAQLERQTRSGARHLVTGYLVTVSASPRPTARTGAGCFATRRPRELAWPAPDRHVRPLLSGASSPPSAPSPTQRAREPGARHLVPGHLVPDTFPAASLPRVALVWPDTCPPCRFSPAPDGHTRAASLLRIVRRQRAYELGPRRHPHLLEQARQGVPDRVRNPEVLSDLPVRQPGPQLLRRSPARGG